MPKLPNDVSDTLKSTLSAMVVGSGIFFPLPLYIHFPGQATALVLIIWGAVMSFGIGRTVAGWVMDITKSLLNDKLSGLVGGATANCVILVMANVFAPKVSALVPSFIPNLLVGMFVVGMMFEEAEELDDFLGHGFGAFRRLLHRDDKKKPAAVGRIGRPNLAPEARLG